MSKRIANSIFVILLAIGTLAFAQTAAQPATAHPAANEPNQAAPAPPAPSGAVTPADQGQNTPAAELAKTSENAAEGDETDVFKHSAVVRIISHHLGISTEAGYWIFYSLDFILIALFLGWLWKKYIPSAFRTRTASIRKTMDDAQAASADANRRLSEIEARLARIDKEIADMASAAESEAAAEEARIREAAEQDSRRIVEGAQAEIESASRIARRDLKAYAADLAVSLAEKRIQVDPGTDHQLVQNFSRELGSGNGQGGH